MGYVALIDHDSPAAIPIPELFSKCRIVGVTPKNCAYIRTSRGWHVVIELHEKLSPTELIAFQAICGSDQMREALNLMRSRVKRCSGFWKKRSNILFEYKVTQ